MTPDDPAVRPSRPDPPAPPREAASLGDHVWRALKYLVIAGLILGGLAVAGLLALAVMLRSSFPEVEALPARVSWTTQAAQLTSDRPVIRGTLTLTATSVRAASMGRVGVNAGAPTVTGTDALASPIVRLTVTGPSGTPQACEAPCERELSSDFACRDGTCRMVLDVVLEVLPQTMGTAEAVQVGIAGGISADLREGELPAGLIVDLALETPDAP